MIANKMKYSGVKISPKGKALLLGMVGIISLIYFCGNELTLPSKYETTSPVFMSLSPLLLSNFPPLFTSYCILNIHILIHYNYSVESLQNYYKF